MSNDKHQLVARTTTESFRVGSISGWTFAQSRWAAATNEGRNTAVTVDVFLDGAWRRLQGDLAVRSIDDPGFQNLRLANAHKTISGTDRITVRASDYRKVR